MVLQLGRPGEKQENRGSPPPSLGGDSSNLSRLPITTDNGRDPGDYPEHQDPADLYRADGAVAVPGWEDHNSSRCPRWSQRCLQEVAFTCSPQVLLAGSPQPEGGGSCTFRSSGGNSRQLFFFFYIFLNVSSVQLLGETGGLMLEHVNLLVLHFSISRTVIFDWFYVISIKLLPGFNTAPFINES